MVNSLVLILFGSVIMIMNLVWRAKRKRLGISAVKYEIMILLSGIQVLTGILIYYHLFLR